MGLECLKRIHALDPDALLAVMTVDDRSDTRTVYDDFVTFSTDNKVKIRVARNRAESENIVDELRPDLCIVVGWYWLFSNEILRKVRRGFVGIHNSLLPKYRGGSPLVWAMINGEKKTGLSLFSMSEGIDNGLVWAQKSVTIGHNDYVSDVLEKLEKNALHLLEEKYILLIRGKLRPSKQNERYATYCAQRFPADGLINWNLPAKRVYNFIRAQSHPYPGAFTLFEGKKLVIWKAHLQTMTYYGTPGQVARVANDGVYVICGDQKPIVLDVVEQEGSGGAQPANAIIRSFKIRF
jgi:methionyl-tRNA formyltransferase